MGQLSRKLSWHWRGRCSSWRAVRSRDWMTWVPSCALPTLSHQLSAAHQPQVCHLLHRTPPPPPSPLPILRHLASREGHHSRLIAEGQAWNKISVGCTPPAF